MTEFVPHTLETAPEGSKEVLKQTAESWGFVPKLHGMLAESPVALKAYSALFGFVSEGTFSPIEQQVVYMAINVFHECEYCTMGHSFLSSQAGMEAEHLAALRNGTPINDTRLEALRSFTLAVVKERGFVEDKAVDAFISAGFKKEHVLEVVAIVATKVISNYTNHLTHTPKEDFMSDPNLAWVAPRNK